jgi:hypothetical protein
MDKFWIVTRQGAVTPYKAEQAAIEAAKQQAQLVDHPLLVFALVGCVKRATAPVEWIPVEEKEITEQELAEIVDAIIRKRMPSQA